MLICQAFAIENRSVIIGHNHSLLNQLLHAKAGCEGPTADPNQEGDTHRHTVAIYCCIKVWCGHSVSTAIYSHADILLELIFC
jgi:hypothetical protein